MADDTNINPENQPDIQIAQAAPTGAPAGVISETTTPTENEGTRGLIDPDAPLGPDGEVIAAAPDDDFDPEAIEPAAGPAAAAAAGASAAFAGYDPGLFGGGRGPLDLLNYLELTTTPLDSILGQAYSRDDGVTGRDVSEFMTLDNTAGYENWTPNAHLGDYTVVPLQLNVIFNALNGVTLNTITLVLPEGVGLCIGDPNAPPVYGTVTLTPDQLANLYILPPPYSDDDISIGVTANVTDRYGAEHTLGPVTIDIVVDAVAQRPEDLDSVVANDGSDQHVMTETELKDQGFTNDGWDKAEYGVTASEGEGRVTVTLSVTASFQDYMDGSEQHYMLVEKLEGFTGPYDTIVIDGVTYFQIPVSNADLAANGGTITIDVQLEAPLVTADTDYSVQTGAMAVENPSDGELREDNNVSIVMNDDRTDFTIDVINSGLTVEMGWASEGDNDAKHLGSANSGDYVYGGAQAGATNSDGSNVNDGAPIRISLNGGQGSTETIQSIVFTYDQSQGMLYYNGQPVPSGSTLPIASLTSVELKFVPADGYSSDDVNLDYAVTIVNDAGASATINGSSTVVIDAVADMGIMGDHSVSYDENGQYTAAAPDAKVNVSGSVTFADRDGSELQFAVIGIPAGSDGWSLAGYDVNSLLNGAAIQSYWQQQGNLPDSAVSGILDPSQVYLLIQVDPATGDITVYFADGSGNMIGVPADSIPGLNVSYNPATGELSYTLEVTTPNADADTSIDIETKGVSVEKDPGDGEYDYANNIAVTDGETVTVDVDVVTGRLQVSLFMHEDGQAAQNQADGSGNKDVTLEPGYDPDTGMPITMELIDPATGAAPTGNEYVSSITIGDLPTEGTIFYNGVPVTAGQVINDPDLTKFSFKPNQNFSGDVTFNFSAEITSTGSGQTVAQDNDTGTFHVDSVADLADAESEATGRNEDGKNQSLDAGDAKYEEGWAKQEITESGKDVDVTFKLTVTFGDLDGSEQAWILIELPAGYSIPEGSPYTLVEEGGVRYARIDLTTDEVAALSQSGGVKDFDITLAMDDTATDKTLNIKVVTQETDIGRGEGHSDDNNLAERVIDQEVNVSHMESTLNIEVGWLYEGNDGNKFGGTAAGPGSDFDPNANGTNGAPINISFTPQGSEELQYIEFTYDSSKGDICWNGEVIKTGDGGMVTIRIQADQLNNLTFAMKEGYSDDDIRLDYQVVIKDGDTTYTVNGSTSVVVDAVADLAVVDERGIGYEDNQTAHTGAAGEEITLTIKTTFVDTDGSENHYLLVQVPGDGWSCAGAETITVYCDANGKPLQPIGVDAKGDFVYSDYSNPVEYFRIDVTGNYSANGEYKITLTPPEYTSDTDVTFKVGTLTEEKTSGANTGREYDYSNNQAYDLDDVKVSFNPIDGTIEAITTVAYEDHMPDKNTGNMTDPGNDGMITLKITGGNETFNGGKDPAVTLTFKFDGDQPGTFTFNGVEYTAQPLGNGEWILTIPGSAVGDGQSEVNIRYNPPPFDDTDVTDIHFEVEVIAEGSNATGTLSGSAGAVVVDAVADKPTDVGSKTDDSINSFKPGDVDGYTGPEIDSSSSWSSSTGLETSTYTPTYEAQSFQFTIAATAAFSDLDGSEAHYLLVQKLGDGWSVDEASLPPGVTLVGVYTHTDGTQYFQFAVDDNYLDADGKITADITLNTPEITGDASYTIKTGGMAEEQNFAGDEPRTDNNIAVTIDGNGTKVEVDAVQSKLVVQTGWAPEDNNASQHLDGGNYNATPGQLGQGYQKVPAGYGFGDDYAAVVKLSLTEGAQDHFTQIVFTYDTAAGEFIYNQNSTAYDVVVTVDPVTGIATVTVTYNPDANGNYNTSSDTFYFRPAENNSDADVNLTYEVTVEGRDGNQVVFNGESTVTIDAVADLPTNLDVDDIGYAGAENGQTAAKPGEEVTLKVNGVQFHDYDDNSELHFIVIGKNLTDGNGKVIDTLSLTEQSIVVKGVGPNGEEYTQTVVLGPNAGSSYIVIAGPNGEIATYPMDAATYNAMMKSADANGYFKIPVLNEFLQLTADGTVSTEVNVNAPSPGEDTSYEATVGGMAQETNNSKNNPDHEVDLNNNQSIVTDKVGFDVNPVTSDPKVSINNGNIYENLTPDANLGDYGLSGGATINVGGIDVGETATITLTFESKSGLDLTSTDPNDVMGVEYNGVFYPAQGPDADGKWTVTIDVAGSADDIDASLVFVPGHNYNSSDIDVSYDITVTDDSSGEQSNFNNTDPASDGYQNNDLAIVVDAVAQIPELGTLEAGYGSTGGESAFVPGKDIALNTQVSFQDYGPDSTEKHFLLVEARAGWEPPHTITLLDADGNPIVDANGNAVEIPVTYVMQFYDGVMYYRIEIPNEYIALYGDNGTLNIQVWIPSPSDANDASFKIGAMAWEDIAEVDGEIRSDNNTAIVIGDEITVNFDRVGSINVSVSGPAYENDTPNAHETHTPDHDDGVLVTINFAAGDTVTDFKFTNYDPNVGTLFYQDGNGNWVPIPDNGYIGNVDAGTQFKFVPGHNYSDEDVNLNFTATITNNASGDTKDVNGNANITVDAVAQLPSDLGTDQDGAIVVDHSTKLAEGSDNTRIVNFQVTAKFYDFEDGSENHFVLVEAKANMYVLDADGNPYPIYYGPDGTPFYKIPVDNADIGPDGTVTVDVTMEIISRKLGIDHDSDTIRIAALAEETTLSGGETTYDNNVAFYEDPNGGITIEHKWPPGDVIWVDPAYENNTQHANQDDPDQPGIQPDERGKDVPENGGKIYFGSIDGDPITEVTLEWDPAQGSIWINGTEYTNGGPIPVSGDDLKNMYFVPNYNYDDADVKLSYTAKGENGSTASGSFPIIVDAVAQMPSDITHDVSYGGGWTAAGEVDGSGNEGTVTVTIGGTFPDTDGSENHYALIEKQPGFTIMNAEYDEIYLDGKTYYRIKIPEGESSVDVQIKLNTNQDYTLKTGIMSEETNYGTVDNLEADASNNVAWNLDGQVTIEVSPVDTTISVTTNTSMLEMEPGDSAAPININWNVGDSDVINYIEFTYDPDKGELFYDGSGNVDYIPNGDGSITVRVNNPTDDDLDKFSFKPHDYSDEDFQIGWNINVSDTRSGDNKDIGGSLNVTVDAVAQKPVITDSGFASDTGYESAVSGGQAVASITLTFPDQDGSETHYAVLEQDGFWKCDYVEINGVQYPVITIFGQDGQPYYAIEITKEMLEQSDPVTVNFHLNAPGSSTDISSDLKIGGIAVEGVTGTDPDNKEVTLNNNWAEGLDSVTVSVAMVDATEINLGSDGTLKENDTTGAELNFTGITDDKEIITEATYEVNQPGTPNGTLIGHIIYDGVSYSVYAGQPVTIDFMPGGYDPNADYRFVLADGNHNDNPVTIDTTTTVQDTASGDEKTFTDSATVDVEATADAPTDINVTDPNGAYGSGSTVTFTVSASFVDVDGSENHYILVEKQAGWTGSYTVVNIDGQDYFRIPVSSTDPNPSVTITLKTPSGLTSDDTINLEVGGMAQEKNGGDTAYTFDGDSVSIDIGVVNATGVSLTMAGMDEDGGFTQMLFAVEGGNNDSISSLTITNLNGGSIVDINGNPVSLSSPMTAAQLAKALAGEYYYKPGANQSGDINVTFNATVKDDASGDSKTFNNQKGTVDVTPVTDIPEDAKGTAKDPSEQAGHVATVSVTLSANFIDYTGSEDHFFLVQLPNGATPPSGWVEVTDSALIAASGMTPPVYQVTANNAGNATFTITIPENYAGGDITFKAGSYEKGVTPPVYEFSDETKATIAGTGEINIDPTATDSTGTVSDTLRDPDAPVNGKVVMSDKDGDTVTVSGIEHNGNPATVDGDTLVINGTYGVLVINVNTGVYTYTLNAGAEPPHGFKESFDVSVTDGRSTGGASIDITLNAPNTDPTAGNQTGNVGGGNEEALAPITGKFIFQDKEGDAVGVDGVSLNGNEATWNDAEQRYELAGEYGMLYIDKDGNYTYVLTDEHSRGTEKFTVNFSDEFGGTGSATLTVNVDYVNHAPEADDHTVSYKEGYDYITGSVSFSDVDLSQQGDTVMLTKVSVGDVDYDIAPTGWTVIPGEYGELKVMANGTYMYTPYDSSTVNSLDEWESFTFTVTDEGGLSDTANLNIGLGNPAPLPAAFSGASIDIDDVFDSLGAVPGEVLASQSIGDLAAADTASTSDAADAGVIGGGTGAADLGALDLNSLPKIEEDYTPPDSM